MYRPDDIKTGLANLIGWRQHYDTSEIKIDDSLTVTGTGQYFQEFHPLVTLENMKAVAPDFSKVIYPAWSSSTTYAIGVIVTSSSILYKAKTININKTPSSNPSSWEPYDALSAWIKEKTDSSILRAIRSFWDDKMKDRTAQSILEDRYIFNGAGRITDKITEATNVAGFELVPIRADGVTTKLNKVGLQFVGTGDITLYLMHSSQMDPIKTKVCTRTKNGSMEWFDLTDWYLPYSSDTIDAGGSWYIVYDQSNIAGQQAIKKDMDWSKSPCSTCDYEERHGFDIWSKYLEIHPFKTSVATPGQLWDVSKNLYTYTSNYGINLQVTIECDVTDLIIRQKKTFQSIIGLQLAVDMLREFAFNPNFRIGRTQQNPAFSKNEILYEIDGDSQGFKKSGLAHDLKNAMKAADLDTINYSNICFPCAKKGIRYKTT